MPFATCFSVRKSITPPFSISMNDPQLALFQNEYGFGNKLSIEEDTLLQNMHSVQKRLGLPLTEFDARITREEPAHYQNNETANTHARPVPSHAYQFCVEMQTGTGKTYVYTKTIFELHKRYGFTKFIIVVPSVAVREGVYKSLETTGEHFGIQYDNVPCRFFIYHSAKLQKGKPQGHPWRHPGRLRHLQHHHAG